MTHRRPTCGRRFYSFILGFAGLVASALSAPADEPARISFDLPASSAEVSLKKFSVQAGVEILFVTEAVAQRKTNGVAGEHTPREAIDLLLRGTGLIAVEDPKTRAFRVMPGDDPNAGGMAPRGSRAIPAQPPSPSLPPSDKVVTVMNPFEVQSTPDNSYGALNSNTVTAFNTALEKLPVSADIFSQTFIDDTASTSVESLVTGFSAGAGNTSPEPGAVADSNQPGDRVSHGHMALRGLATEYSLRDGLLPNGSPTQPGSTAVGFTSAFDVDRVEVIFGPQALLYGSTGAGGVVNMVSKQARIGGPTFGSFTFQSDRYGGKMGLLDYGTSTGKIALRLAVLDQVIDSRRMNIGGPLQGYYLQLAAQVTKNTTVRIEGEQTTYNRISPNGMTLNAGSVAIDSRHGDRLSYLLASHQIQQAASGPSGAGVIDNGCLNWSNINSLLGWFYSERTVDDYEIISADTHWNNWLSTRIEAGYNDWEDEPIPNTSVFYSPTAPSNPLLGNWTISDNGTEPDVANKQGSRSGALRFVALATNDLFGGRGNSRSILSADFLSNRFWSINYGLFQADSNGNVATTDSVPALAKLGSPFRMSIPTLNWTINQGPIAYPYFIPNASRVSLNGVTYVRAMTNPVNPALISPSNPEGVTLGGDGNNTGRLLTKAISGANYTDWLNGRLTTLVGFRLERAFYEEFDAGSAPPAQPEDSALAKATELNYNFGANYRLTNFLRPYFSVSSSFDKPQTLGHDIYGGTPPINQQIGEEVGVKMQNAEGTISGSLAAFHVYSKNEEIAISSTVYNNINPNGLNGIGGPGRGSYEEVDRKSNGVQLTLVAAPTRNWRTRLSAGWNDGSIGASATFAQLYNDQFHENSQGQVTFADGTVVYVPPTFSSTRLTVPSGTAGATPLTVAMLSDPRSVYYANPKPISGQITSTSNGGKVLLSSDPVHGAITTGVAGLPISALQIDPAPSGITIPGAIVVSQAGDVTTGYPEFSLSFTNVYTFSSGWARGFEVGGTVNLGWLYRDFYYFPNNYTGPDSPRRIFYLPTLATFNPIAGYTHKFKRFTWHTQLNISNLFNHYSVLLIPGEITGWTQPTGLSATFSQQPRSYQWTNRISF